MPAIFLARFLPNDLWEAMLDGPRDFLDFDEEVAPQADLISLTYDEAFEQKAKQKARDDLLNDAKFDLKQAQEAKDAESIEWSTEYVALLEAATWRPCSWHEGDDGTHAFIRFDLMEGDHDDENTLTTLVIQRRWADD